jgi:hypothetical protein
MTERQQLTATRMRMLMVAAGSAVGGALTGWWPLYAAALLLVVLLAWSVTVGRRAVRSVAWRRWCLDHHWCPEHDRPDGDCPTVGTWRTMTGPPTLGSCRGSATIRTVDRERQLPMPTSPPPPPPAPRAVSFVDTRRGHDTRRGRELTALKREADRVLAEIERATGGPRHQP